MVRVIHTSMWSMKTAQVLAEAAKLV